MVGKRRAHPKPGCVLAQAEGTRRRRATWRSRQHSQRARSRADASAALTPTPGTTVGGALELGWGSAVTQCAPYGIISSPKKPAKTGLFDAWLQIVLWMVMQLERAPARSAGTAMAISRPQLAAV